MSTEFVSPSMFVASPISRSMYPVGYITDTLHIYRALFRDVDPVFDPFVDSVIVAMLILMVLCSARSFSLVTKIIVILTLHKYVSLKRQVRSLEQENVNMKVTGCTSRLARRVGNLECDPY